MLRENLFILLCSINNVFQGACASTRGGVHACKSKAFEERSHTSNRAHLEVRYSCCRQVRKTVDACKGREGGFISNTLLSRMDQRYMLSWTPHHSPLQRIHRWGGPAWILLRLDRCPQLLVPGHHITWGLHQASYNSSVASRSTCVSM